MSKISIGLRGWRFDEDEVFDGDGEIRPFDRIPEETRHRLVRLSSLLGEPCNACWLVHGEGNVEQCNTGTVVYGEPLAEVLLCDDHESDFLYWFREAGGRAHAGGADLQDEFHEWFADGGRAPEGYAGLEHVSREPDALPEVVGGEDGGNGDGTDGIPGVERQAGEMDEAEQAAMDVNLDDLDV